MSCPLGETRSVAVSSTYSLNFNKEVDNLRDRTMQAMTKTVTPIKVTFTNLTYKVRVKSTKNERRYLGYSKFRDETLLKGVSGYALPG